jgi:plastocyanin
VDEAPTNDETADGNRRLFDTRGVIMRAVRPFIFVTILGAALAAAACGDSTPAPSGATTAVSIVSGSSSLTTTAYSPNPLNVPVGTTIRWTNNDTTPHTTTSDGGAWNSGNMNGGATFDFKFNTAGTFPYHCTLHANMVGTIVVQ